MEPGSSHKLTLACFLLGSLLQTGITASSKLALELLDTTCRVDVLQLASVKRMANVADVNF
jgi:hypothetical protein